MLRIESGDGGCGDIIGSWVDQRDYSGLMKTKRVVSGSGSGVKIFLDQRCAYEVRRMLIVGKEIHNKKVKGEKIFCPSTFEDEVMVY